ncbi:MAG TPA: hypothetical protein VGN34_03865 [Ktedonobacteraceae bacterium]|jgi:hypothetical protein
MGTQSTRKPVSDGICAFCKAELPKNKMTQHLKSCKQRLATIAEQEKNAQQPKTRLFHILAEGRLLTLHEQVYCDPSRLN